MADCLMQLLKISHIIMCAHAHVLLSAMQFSLFMEQLETSGLLNDEEQAAQDALAGGAGAGDGPTAGGPATSDAPAAAAAADQGDSSTTTKAAVGDQPPTSTAGGSADTVDATTDAPAAAADASAAGPAEEGQQGEGEEGAEQRVLGYLRQAPEWSKVLDCGSAKVYYWHLTSNEVGGQVDWLGSRRRDCCDERDLGWNPAAAS